MIESEVSGRELFVSQVSKMVHFKVVSLKTSSKSGVVSFNIFEVLHPDLESVLIFDGIILFVHLRFPDFEHKILMRLHGGLHVEEADSSHSD